MTKRIGRYLPAALVFVGVLGLWELAVRAFGIQQFLLPPPSSIAAAFVEHFDELMTVGRNTLVEAVGGLVIGGVAALVVAFAIARWASASRALLPFAIAANSVPIIAFAPIMNNWFGILNPLSKMMVVAVLVFFPIMINTLRGLTLVDQASLELMRSYAASELAIFAKVRVPNALPYIFTALKVSATLSLIGAIVAIHHHRGGFLSFRQCLGGDRRRIRREHCLLPYHPRDRARRDPVARFGPHRRLVVTRSGHA